MKSHLMSATCIGLFLLGLSASAQSAPVSGQGTWETTLQGRDFDSNIFTIEGWYDTVLDITWLADANALMTWPDANSWASGLDFGGGIDNWRLPDANPINGVAEDFDFSFDGSTDRGQNISAPGSTYVGSAANEMAHLFYNTLGNLSQCEPSSVGTCTTQTGGGLTNTGPFSNIESDDAYWSSTGILTVAGGAWTFDFPTGEQGGHESSTENDYAWAVHSGDVGVAVSASSVPVPAAAWLFGSGLLGLIGVAKRKKS